MKPILPALSQTGSPEAAYKKRYLITMTVTLATVLLTLDVTIVSVAIPSMMGTLGATLDEIAWVSTGYILATVIVMAIASWLSDLLGRRNYFVLSILFFTLASVMCGFSSSLGELVFWRVVQGFSGGGLVTSAQMALMETFPASELGKAMGIWSVGVMLGPTLGPPLGGWLTETLSWPWIFYVNLPVGGAVLLLSLIYVPDSRFAKKPGYIDFVGLILMTIGIGCLQALLERGHQLDWLASKEVVAYCYLIPGALALLVWHELRSEHPIINMHLWANRQFVACTLLMTATGFVTTAYLFAFPVLVQKVQGQNAVDAGLAILPYMLTNVVGFMTVGKLMTRPGIDLRWLVAMGTLCGGIGLWGHSTFTAESGGMDFLVPQIILGFSSPLCLMPLTVLSTARLPTELVSSGNALISFARQIGGSFGIAVFATLTAHFYKTSRGELIRHLNSFTDIANARLEMFSQLMLNQGAAITEAPRKALLLLDTLVNRQAQVIAFNQSMAALALIALLILTVPLIVTGRPGNNIGHDENA